MINIKSPREIELMRKAGEILSNTRAMLIPHIKPGMTTAKLDKLAHEYIISQGATPSFKDYNGFSGSICTSINEVVVHGIPSKKQVLKSGDILSLDRKSTRLNSSHVRISYAVFCLKKKNK